MQTSPISFVARGKGTFSACNKGNRRRLHAGKIRAELGIINLRAGKMKQILCFDWLPSGKMDPSRQLRISRVGPTRKGPLLKWPYNKTFIDQASKLVWSR